MANAEVETILREIRERVIAEQESLAVGAARAPIKHDTDGSLSPSGEKPESSAAASLARLSAYLTATGRAWDRLPPLVSNRSGPIARLELWIKGQLKRGTRWFAWEQINFNAAVHHALRDSLEVLHIYDDALERLRNESEAQRRELEQTRPEIEMQRQEIHALRQESNAQSRAIDAQRQVINAQLQVIEEQRAGGESQRLELDARLMTLAQEQRVCFKQLSLESSEALVLQDRACRNLEARLEKLEKRSSGNRKT